MEGLSTSLSQRKTNLDAVSTDFMWHSNSCEEDSEQKLTSEGKVLVIIFLKISFILCPFSDLRHELEKESGRQKK